MFLLVLRSFDGQQHTKEKKLKKPIVGGKKSLRAANNALDSNKTDSDIEFGHYDGSASMMDYIQQYADSCYFLDIDPTVALRLMFPKFEWRYVESEGDNDSDFLVAVQASDFIWVVPFVDNGYQMSLALLAKKIRRKKPSRFFWCGQKPRSKRSTGETRMAKKYGCSPSYFLVMNQ